MMDKKLIGVVIIFLIIACCCYYYYDVTSSSSSGEISIDEQKQLEKRGINLGRELKQRAQEVYIQRIVDELQKN